MGVMEMNEMPPSWAAHEASIRDHSIARSRAIESLETTVEQLGNLQSEPHTQRMNDLNREELDAKLQATEARMDARLERFDKDMRQAVSDFRLEIQPLKNLKANIWGATAVTIGVMVAVLSYGVASFDSGRDTSAVIQEMKQQSFETRQLLEQIKAQQAALQAEPAADSAPPIAPQQ